jgi:hypothetical protein
VAVPMVAVAGRLNNRERDETERYASKHATTAPGFSVVEGCCDQAHGQYQS